MNPAASAASPQSGMISERLRCLLIKGDKWRDDSHVIVGAIVQRFHAAFEEMMVKGNDGAAARASALLKLHWLISTFAAADRLERRVDSKRLLRFIADKSHNGVSHLLDHLTDVELMAILQILDDLECRFPTEPVRRWSKVAPAVGQISNYGKQGGTFRVAAAIGATSELGSTPSYVATDRLLATHGGL